MTGLLAHAAAAFVEPSPAREGVAPVVGTRALVLGRPAEAVPVAAALANDLRREERAPAALLCIWLAGPPRPAPACRAAQRLAARLEARGLAAVGRGRLAWLPLDADAAPAAAAIVRAAGAADVPAVVAVTGPRFAAIDALLPEQDLIVIVASRDADPALAELVASGLAGLPARLIVRGPIESTAARLLALAGRGRLGVVGATKEGVR